MDLSTYSSLVVFPFSVHRARVSPCQTTLIPQATLWQSHCRQHLALWKKLRADNASSALWMAEPTKARESYSGSLTGWGNHWGICYASNCSLSLFLSKSVKDFMDSVAAAYPTRMSGGGCRKGQDLSPPADNTSQFLNWRSVMTKKPFFHRQPTSYTKEVCMPVLLMAVSLFPCKPCLHPTTAPFFFSFFLLPQQKWRSWHRLSCSRVYHYLTTSLLSWKQAMVHFEGHHSFFCCMLNVTGSQKFWSNRWVSQFFDDQGEHAQIEWLTLRTIINHVLNAGTHERTSPIDTS